MTALLSETMDAMDQRKLAMLGRPASDERPDFEVQQAGPRELVLLFSGFDVSAREVWALSADCAEAVRLAVQSGEDVKLAIQSMWVDAIATGMLHERRNPRL